MATVQQFDFLVRASTDIAVQKLHQLGEAAAKASGEIEGVENVDLQAWGSSAFNAATRAGAGMLSLATAASNVVEQANFVDQVFKDAAPGIKKWAETADRTALLSQEAALHAAAYLGVFGQAINLTGEPLAKFSINLVELAADLASVANTSVDSAVVAIGAAMRNEYEPMRKYGIVLNEDMLKQALFNATGQEISGTLSQQQKIIGVNQALFSQLGFAIGDVDRTFGGMANQSRYLDAQMQNLKAQVGEGLRPAFITLFEAANSVVGGLRQIPAPVAEIGGKFALAATTVTGFVGAMAIAGAKFPQYITGFKKITKGINDMNAAGGKGQAFVGLVGAAAAITGTVVAIDLLNTGMNALNNVAGKTKSSLLDMGVAQATGDIDGLYESFLKLTETERATARWSDVFEQAGTSIRLVGADTAVTVEDMDRAFNKLFAESPQGAIELVAHIHKLNEGLDHSSSQYKNNEGRVNAWTKKINEAVTAAQLQGDTTKFTQEQMEIFGDETLTAAESSKIFQEETEELTKAFEEQMKVLNDNKKKWDDYGSKVGEITDKFADAADKAEILGDSLSQSMGTNDVLDNLIEIRGATDDMIEGFKDDDGNFQGLLMNMDTFNDVGRDNLKAIEDISQAVGTEMTRAYKDSGGSMTEMMRTQSNLRDEFIHTATAAGLPIEKVNELADAIFATPEEVAIAVKLAGQEEARRKIETLGLALDDIPTEYRTQYMALIDSGDFVGAWKLGQQIIDDQGDLAATLIAEAAPIGPKLSEVQRDADGKPIKVAVKPEPESTKAATDKMQRGTKDLTTDVNSIPQSTSNTTNIMQGWTKDLTTDVNPVAKQTWSVTNTMQSWTRDLTTDVNAFPTSPMPARNSMQWTVGANPLGVQTNAHAGDTGGARNSMQGTMNANPLSINVNPRLIVDAAWRNTVASLKSSVSFGGVSYAPPGSTAPASAGAMTVGVPAPVVAGHRAPTSTGTIINMNISMPLPVGADETRVVAALKKYTKNNGALPLKVAGLYA